MRYRNTVHNFRTRIWDMGTLLIVPELECKVKEHYSLFQNYNMRYRNTLRNSRTKIWGTGTLLVVPELEYEYIPELEWNTFCWEISYLSLHLKCFEQMSVGLEQGELMNQLQNMERICGQVEPEDQDGFRRRIKDGVKKMDRSFAKTGSIFRCKKYSSLKGKRNSLLKLYLPVFGVNHFLLK